MITSFAVAAALAAGPAPQDDDPIIALVKSRVADPSKPFVLLVRIEARPGSGPAIEEAFAAAIPPTKKEKGAELYELSRDAASPDSFLLYERWSTVADLAAHLKAPHITKLLAEIADLTAGPPDLQVHLPAGG